MEVKTEASTQTTGVSTSDEQKLALSSESPVEYEHRSIELAKAIIKGMSRLIEGQQQLAEKTGLSLSRVFPQSNAMLEGRKVEEALANLFRSGSARLDELNALFEDMIEHQLALASCVDDVALTSINYLSPDQLKLEFPDRRIDDSNAWRFLNDRHRELFENDKVRFQMLVRAGLVESYLSSRVNAEADTEFQQKTGKTDKHVNT